MKSQQLAQAGARPAVQVTLPAFQGPFDLLIYLVERDKLDIHDIAVAEITSKFIESLKVIEFDPELASDFIFMAAYLLELKSRSLLPRIERVQLSQEPDPRQELIMRLVEYKRFKELAASLEAMITSGNYTYTRRTSIQPDTMEMRPLAPMSLDNLFSAFIRVLEDHQVEVKELAARGIPIAEKISVIRKRLASGPASFEEFAAGLNLSGVIAVFLAVLEMVRLGEVNVRQETAFAPIIIAAEKDDTDERAR